MKNAALVPLLLLAILVVGGCASRKGEGFSIYLLARDTPVSEMPAISHVELADKPLISMDDIVSYTKETHEIRLTAACFERTSRLEVPVSGIVFIACVDRNPVYWGAFWTPISSVPFHSVGIVKPFPSDGHTLKIQLGYPLQEFFEGTDPRSDPGILQSLERASKLQ